MKEPVATVQDGTKIKTAITDTGKKTVITACRSQQKAIPSVVHGMYPDTRPERRL